MKIFCIGRNYAKHIEELKNEKPEQPVVFLKPPTALLKNNKPLYLPDFSADVHYEVELVFRIGKQGKNIAKRFAHRYIDAFGLGIDFTARDIQSRLKEKGLPWELAKGFDGSAVIGNWQSIDNWSEQLNFSLVLNGEIVQQGRPVNMLFKPEEIISFLSMYFTLQQGDLVYTGTPEGVGPVGRGDRLVGFIEGAEQFTCNIL